MIRILAVIAALICATPAIAQPLPAKLDKSNAIVIDTTKGRIVIKLRPDIAPQHAERIKLLARDGYYNNVPFHRVIEGFMAQSGDGKNFRGGTIDRRLIGDVHFDRRDTQGGEFAGRFGVASGDVAHRAEDAVPAGGE